MSLCRILSPIALVLFSAWQVAFLLLHSLHALNIDTLVEINLIACKYNAKSLTLPCVITYISYEELSIFKCDVEKYASKSWNKVISTETERNKHLGPLIFNAGLGHKILGFSSTRQHFSYSSFGTISQSPIESLWNLNSQSLKPAKSSVII